MIPNGIMFEVCARISNGCSRTGIYGPAHKAERISALGYKRGLSATGYKHTATLPHGLSARRNVAVFWLRRLNPGSNGLSGLGATAPPLGSRRSPSAILIPAPPVNSASKLYAPKAAYR